MNNGTIITMRDIRAVKMCSRGTRAFFIKHDLDWDEFLSEGIEAQKLLDTGDAMAIKVVENACGRK